MQEHRSLIKRANTFRGNSWTAPAHIFLNFFESCCADL
jgi:hypothetical protein